MEEKIKNYLKKISMRYKAHPWHGVDLGNEVPNRVTAFIEVVPSDTVKYEVDKDSGFMTIDRPQKFSNIMPAMYGFLPRTYCGDKVAQHCMDKTDLTDIVGDGDPLDICVLSEKEVTHGNILAQAIPIGGFRMIDGGEADDKIIAVLKDDSIYGHMRDISELPEKVSNRLKHYFLTYKAMPGDESYDVKITDRYNAEEAKEIIELSQKDYEAEYELITRDRAREMLSEVLSKVQFS
jgi:inorganic pyrophosphatase